MSQIKLTIILDIPDGVVPDVQYSDVPPEPPYLMAPLPIEADAAAIAAQAFPDAKVTLEVPRCPQHGPMTFHQTKKDGTPFPRYSCDTRMPNGAFCPTKMVRVAA
jgi:hypothetical protein